MMDILRPTTPAAAIFPVPPTLFLTVSNMPAILFDILSKWIEIAISALLSVLSSFYFYLSSY